MNLKTCVLISTILVMSEVVKSNDSRYLRHFYYPEPARTQLVIGLGLPVGPAHESVTIGTVFRLNTNLPNWNSSYFQGVQSRTDVTRWEVYSALEALVNSTLPGPIRNLLRANFSLNLGADGHQCLLRAICDAATVPFDQQSGLSAQLLHILLTPSSSGEDESQPERDYVASEQRGRVGDCHDEHQKCPLGLLNYVSRFFMG